VFKHHFFVQKTMIRLRALQERLCTLCRARRRKTRRNSRRSRTPRRGRRKRGSRLNVIANQQLGSTPVQARGILQQPEEQSRTGGCQSSSVEGQPQCPGMRHSSNPNARSLSHSPSAPPPSFTQSPYPPRSLVCDGQTHPHRPRLVVSHSTCPPLSSPPTRTAL